ncbi:MAG TPA: arsenate reductase ArsC [bacterium]|nr:arsenate reductase ArsC [bacterium]
MDRNVLFLCTGNSARSQMGEVFFRKYAGDAFKVFSAGTRPGDEIFPPVVEVMREVGVDLSGKKPQPLKRYLGHTHFELVIIVCSDADAECPAIFGGARRVVMPFEDPSKIEGSPEEILAETRRIRDQIESRIKAFVEAY